MNYTTDGNMLLLHLLCFFLSRVDDLKKTVTSVNGDFVIFERNSRIFGYNDTALGVC